MKEPRGGTQERKRRNKIWALGDRLVEKRKRKIEASDGMNLRETIES